MRFQKFLILFLVVSLSLSLAFSQTALSVRKNSAKPYETPYQMRLETQAEAADARAKEAEAKAAAAKIGLEELQRSGDKKDRRAFSKKELELKADLAQAEATAAQAKAEALRSRAESVKDKADTARKLSSDTVKDKKAQAKYYDALWLQQLAAKNEKDIAKADDEAARKQKIAAEAAGKVEAINQEIQRAEAKEAIRQAKLNEKENSRKSKTEIADAELVAAAEKEAAKNARAAQEAERKAQERAAAEKTKADREATKRAQAEQDAVRKSESLAEAERAKANRVALEKAREQQEADRKAQERAAAEKIKAQREAARIEEETAKKLAAEKDAQLLAAIRADDAKRDQETQQLADAKKAELARQAKADESLRKKKVMEAAVAPTIAPLAAAGHADSEDPLLELLRQKQNELDAAEKAPVKEAIAEAQNPVAPKTETKNSASQRVLNAKRENSERAFQKQERRIAASNPLVIPAVASAPIQPVAIEKPIIVAQAVSADSNVSAEGDLLEILRRKQAEMDAQENSGKTQTAPTPVSPQPKAEPKTRLDRSTESRPAAPVTQPKSEVVVSQPAVAPEAQDKLLELLRTTQAELDAKEAGTGKTPTSAEVRKSAPVEGDKEREKRIRQIEAEIKAKEEAFKKSAAKPSAPATTKAPKVVSQPKPASKDSTAAAPIVEPGSKEARLTELLRKYKADEITPHEYHMERAKIIAEP